MVGGFIIGMTFAFFHWTYTKQHSESRLGGPQGELMESVKVFS